MLVQTYRLFFQTLFSILFFTFLLIGQTAIGQTEATLVGHVTTEEGKAIPLVQVTVFKTPYITTGNDSGFFSLKVPAYKLITVAFSSVGFETVKQSIRLEAGEKRSLNVVLPLAMHKMKEVTVTGDYERAGGFSKLSMTDFNQMPNASGNFESLLKTLPGVSSANELSSQYSVRGGNFDENLVFVNDVEIVRPFLIRSGQQEGLSFINPDMVSGVKFSAGGFDARYGDKMSSVLDVSYRKPVAFDCAAQASLLGGGLTIGNASKNKRWSYIGGVRYKTSQYLLGSLQTKGEYSPSFIDAQTLITYQPNSKWEFSMLGNFAQNKYLFIPETRTTNFGSLTQVYSLSVYFDGKEVDKYRSALGAFTATYKPSSNLTLKLISSGYSSTEQETFDIEGQYYINELDYTAGSTTYGDSSINLGVAGMLNHARNFLWNNTWSMGHIGTYSTPDHSIRWSVAMKKTDIEDKLNEWTLIDSLGYAMPYSAESISLTDYVNGKHHIQITEYTGYAQDTWQFDLKSVRAYLTGGARFNFNSYTQELLVNPRVRFSVKPAWVRDVMFFVSTGAYSQPPVYKEMRDMQGNLNPDTKAQKSIHFVAGADYNLKIWDRPFKLTSEIYYKHFSDLIPYKVDNVRIRYSAKNDAVGYAQGLDMKLNGEFIPGIESWASLSVMKTEENITDDYYFDTNGKRVEPGYYSRPTDQRVNFSLFFRDYLPNNPTLQMHMTVAYGSSFHISPPKSRYDQTMPIGPYRRVDIGFSKVLRQMKNETTASDNEATAPTTSVKKWIKECIISAEIFNILDIYNTGSYLWIHTVPSQENVQDNFAIPNYLTSRRLNVRLAMKF